MYIIIILVIFHGIFCVQPLEVRDYLCYWYWLNFDHRCLNFLVIINKNISLKLPVGVSPLQLVNLHRNRRYSVIKLHTWFCLSYFLKTNNILLHLSIFYEYQQFFQHRICFSIQTPDYSDPWPSFSTPYLFLDTTATSTCKFT